MYEVTKNTDCNRILSVKDIPNIFRIINATIIPTIFCVKASMCGMEFLGIFMFVSQ